MNDRALEAALVAWFDDDEWPTAMSNGVADNCRESMRAAIEAHRAALSDETGDMVLVPREPTEAMLWKGWRSRNPQNTLEGLRNSYRAMLAASQEPRS